MSADRSIVGRGARLWRWLRVLALGVAAAGLPVFAAAQTAIPIPDDPFERPERVYVLPVFVVPSDRTHLVESGRGRDLDGQPMSAAARDAFRAARANLVAHLRVAQEKYRLMLEHPAAPIVDIDRGTFALASWNAGLERPEAVDGTGVLRPLVYRSPNTFAAIAKLAYGAADAHYAELLDHVGCLQQSCPLIFAMVIVREVDECSACAVPLNGYPGIGGKAVNVGYNGGSGYLLMPLPFVARAHEPTSIMQSTLLHELGHTFGLSHVWEVYGGHAGAPANPSSKRAFVSYCDGLSEQELPAAERKYSLSCSESVMSYNGANWTAGCFQSLAPPAQGCAYPDDPSIVATLPGRLIAEDLYHLSINRLVLPQHAYIDAIDRGPGELLRFFPGPGGVDVPGHARFDVTTPNSDFGTIASAAVGAHSNAILPAHAPFVFTRMWHSNHVGPWQWATFEVSFPGPVDLSRLRVYTQYGAPNGGAMHRANAVRVRKPFRSVWTQCKHASVQGPDQDVAPIWSCNGSDRYQVGVQAGASGYVVVRGMRFFRATAAGEEELFGTREPRVRTDFGDAFGGAVAHIAGSDQVIDPFASPFDGAHAWHSAPVTPNAWVSVEVEFPDAATLAAVRVHSGHTGTAHVAQQVQVERRDAFGNYQFIMRVPTDHDALVTFAPKTSEHWKIAFQTGASGYVVVRGLQFFDDEGRELFPARIVP
jgi:hypothetical protein